MRSILKRASGIVAAVIAGVVVWYLTIIIDEPTIEPPPPTFVEKLSGTFTLQDWSEATRPITMGVSVDRGKLRIDKSQDANGELSIWDSALHPQGPPADNRSRIRCGRSVSRATEELGWVSGGQRNVAVDWVRGIDSVWDMVWPAFCGGRLQTSAPFRLHFEQPSSGPATLEMTNSEGQFVWSKN